MTGHRVDHKARAEDIAWFVETGENLSGAAQRLGISTDGVEKWCVLVGMRDELNILRSREPLTDMFKSERSRTGAFARWAS